jgi:hypothetical protein
MYLYRYTVGKRATYVEIVCKASLIEMKPNLFNALGPFRKNAHRALTVESEASCCPWGKRVG